MKKTILSLLVAGLFSSLSAQEVHGHDEHGSKFYIIAKGLSVLGEEVEKNYITSEGDSGYGFGVDIGYKLPYHLSVELFSNYAENKVSVKNVAGSEDASYVAYGAALEYTYHAAKHVGLFVKGGFEIEDAEVGRESESESGAIYAFGAEYEMNSHYDLLIEYEGSTVESTMGPLVFAGVKYNF